MDGTNKKYRSRRIPIHITGSEALVDMKALVSIFICCLMGMGESFEDHIADESTLIDMVLEELPVKKCDSFIVSRSPLQNVGRSTIFFNHIDDLISFMGSKEDFVQTLSTMECFIMGSYQIMKSPPAWSSCQLEEDEID